jgi:hypothetical protein
MSLAAQYHAEHKARLARMGAVAPKPAIKIVSKKPKKSIRPIDPAPFYRQMWFYDLVCPRKVEQEPLTVLHIRDAVCKYFNVSTSDIESSRRQGAIVYPRQIAFFLARSRTDYSYPQIGRRFGNRDHTTIMHGCRRIEERMKADWTVAYDIAHLEEML